MKKKILLIDGNNLGYRAAHKFNLTSEKGVPTGVIFGFIYILRPLIVAHNPNTVIVAFDGSRSKYRLELLPGYKERETTLGDSKEAFVNQLQVLKDSLPYFNISVAHGRHAEADDVIYKLVRQHKGEYITIVSSDKDFIPLLSGTVKVFNPFKNKLITPINCSEVYGYDPSQFLDYLILKGDKSDKIPGVPGMGEKRIKEFIDEWESIEDWIDADPKDKWNKYPIKEVYKKNKALISLPLYYRKAGRFETFNLKEPDYNFQKIHAICRQYNIRKFLAKSFLKPFEELG